MTNQIDSNLFKPYQLGTYTLKHRVVMPPLTRLRSKPDDSVSDMMVEHYGQRASDGGLMILEAAAVSRNGIGYQGMPGLYDDRHIAGYSRIADAVHAKGGIVFAQIIHTGRVSHTALQPESSVPLTASVVPYNGHAFVNGGFVPVSQAREITKAEINLIIADYRSAAMRVKAAGIDGVEIHSANGYLPDQFLQNGSNHRTDEYGGSVENRARFLLQVVEAVTSVWGPGKVGVRISPSGTFNEMTDSDPEAVFGYLANELNKHDLAYLHIIEPRIAGDTTKDDVENDAPVASRWLRKVYTGTILAAGGFTKESAEQILQQGDADLTAFGRFFTSNPDLPERFKLNLPLTPYDRSAFWGGTELAYIDYKPYAVAQEELVGAN